MNNCRSTLIILLIYVSDIENKVQKRVKTIILLIIRVIKIMINEPPIKTFNPD